MTALALQRLTPLRREEESSKRIPYSAHLNQHIVGTDDGAYILVIRCAGASFDSADDDELNQWHKALNSLTRKIADPRVALWSTIIRRDENSYPKGEFPPGFADRFNKKYAERVSNELLMVNELFLTIVYRPQASQAGKFLLKLFKMADAKAVAQERDDSIEYLEKLANDVLSSLDRRYDATRLGLYEFGGRWYSEVEEFLAYLINGRWQRMPLARVRIGHVLNTSRVIFGTETVEIRTPTSTHFGAMLGIKEYTPETQPGTLNGLLSLPFPFVLTQSFTYLTKESAKFIVKTQRNRMQNSGDDAVSQIAQFDDLLDDLQSNRIVMGEHHFSLFVRAESIERLSDHVAIADAALSDVGFVAAREDLALEAAYWAQLPGNFVYRPRRAPITSKNWAGFSSLHNYPAGRRNNNHWGDAVTLLVSEANTPVYFSFHASDPLEDDGGSRKDVGDTILLGPKGTGKTVVVTAMAAFLQKFNETQVFFTKDRDSEIFIRACGGKYLPFQIGRPTGCSPFQLDPTPENVQMWFGLVCSLISRPVTVAEQDQIQRAINWLAPQPRVQRRLGRLLDHLDVTEGQDSIYMHLKRWCYARGDDDKDGMYAWVFDNKTDTVAAVVNGESNMVGFDVTAFLDDPVVRGPVARYLFYLVNGLVDGRRITIFISEFWKFLDDEYCAKFVHDHLKTIRKKNGFLVLDSQSPADVLTHPIARTLIEQTSTKILFPNPDADRDEYMEGLNLSEREFALIKEELRPGARTFLIKQSGNSIVAKLDLKGFDFELDVLSGRSSNIRLVEQIIAEHGDDPDVWLPIFEERRKRA